MVFQALRPQTILRQQKKLGIPNRTPARCLDCSDTLWSLYLSGARGLSHEMQIEVFHLFRFFDELAKRSDVPCDFRQAERIRGLWKQRKQRLAENQAIRFARELEGRAKQERRAAALGGV
jgi:hypothetical protein